MAGLGHGTPRLTTDFANRAKNKELGQLLSEVHETLAWLFVLLVVGHTAAALKHHFIDKDDILIRMSPDHRKHSGEQ